MHFKKLLTFILGNMKILIILAMLGVTIYGVFFRVLDKAPSDTEIYFLMLNYLDKNPNLYPKEGLSVDSKCTASSARNTYLCTLKLSSGFFSKNKKLNVKLKKINSEWQVIEVLN